jgi:hypothetical protein
MMMRLAGDKKHAVVSKEKDNEVGRSGPDCLASWGSGAQSDEVGSAHATCKMTRDANLRNILIPTSARIKYFPLTPQRDSSGYLNKVLQSRLAITEFS